MAAKKKTKIKTKTKKLAPKKKTKAATKPKIKAKTSPVARSISPDALPTSRRGSGSGGGAAERFDRSPYDIPMMDLGEAIALADALLESKPPAKAAPAVVEEAASVERLHERAKLVHGATSVTEAPADARPFDVAMDRAWLTFVRRIQDQAELPIERFPDAVEASKVYAIVHDLSILKLNYLAEFAQIGARIDALKREGLLDDARQFAGAAFLDEVLYWHAEYGRAIGVMDVPQLDNDEQDRGEARLALTDAIAEYTYQVLALARAGKREGWKAISDALEPIVELRARQGRDLRAKSPRSSPAAHPPINAVVVSPPA